MRLVSATATDTLNASLMLNLNVQCYDAKALLLYCSNPAISKN